MDEQEARMKLADQLMNLVEALRDPDMEAGEFEELFGKRREMKLHAILGDDVTIVAIKRWTEEEIKEIRDKAVEDDEWPEFIEG